LITVPLYDTLGTEAIQHIVNQTELVVIFASGDKVLAQVFLLRWQRSNVTIVSAIDFRIS
jgi:long-subunit acyl-CoA synthetase (AMP-forming)